MLNVIVRLYQQQLEVKEKRQLFLLLLSLLEIACVDFYRFHVAAACDGRALSA